MLSIKCACYNQMDINWNWNRLMLDPHCMAAKSFPNSFNFTFRKREISEFCRYKQTSSEDICDSHLQNLKTITDPLTDSPLTFQSLDSRPKLLLRKAIHKKVTKLHSRAASKILNMISKIIYTNKIYLCSFQFSLLNILWCYLALHMPEFSLHHWF